MGGENTDNADLPHACHMKKVLDRKHNHPSASLTAEEKQCEACFGSTSST
jgi:hypothetical protein